MTPFIKETVERLRAEAVDAHKKPSWVDPYFMDDTAALIERLAGALEEIELRHGQRNAFDGPSFLADEMAEMARSALSGEPTP